MGIILKELAYSDSAKKQQETLCPNLPVAFKKEEKIF